MTNILIKFWLPPILWLAVIFYLSSLPAPELPDPLFPHFDKVAHFGVFGLLALLVYRAWRFGSKASERVTVRATFILCFGYALLDEYHQSFTPGRQVDWVDVCADTAGILVALVLGRLMYDFMEQWCERKRSNPRVTSDA